MLSNNRLQVSYNAYEKSTRYPDSTAFLVESLLRNTEAGHIDIVKEQYNRLFTLFSSGDLDLLVNINKKIDLEFSRLGLDRGIDISVIIPFHNRQDAIFGCIDSVLTQSIHNIEIVLVDDGSSDNSVNIVRGINDSRIKLIQLKTPSGNSGTPRNVAMNLASGKYVAFVDSDDCIEKNYLKELFDGIVSKKSDVVMANNFRKIQYVKGKRLENIIKYKSFNYGKSQNNQDDCFFTNSFVIWDKLYNRKLLTDNNIVFSDSKIGADSLFLSKIYFYAKNIFVIENKDKYKYFAFAEGSVTKKYRSIADVEKEDKPYVAIFRWLSENNISDNYVFIQWVRRLLSISYCLKSGNFQVGQKEKKYIMDNFFNAPFEEVISFLKKNDMDGNISDVEKFSLLVKG